MRFKLRTLLLLVGLTTVLTPVAMQFFPWEINSPVPESVLKQLDTRFERLKPNMNYDQMFDTFGLDRYQSYLESRAMFSVDGRTACRLISPQHTAGREAKLATAAPPLAAPPSANLKN